jgi:hypothetical protein
MTPDGKKLLVGGYQSRGELVRYDPSSKQFVPFLGGIAAYDVAFSRDGKSIAYINLTCLTRRSGQAAPTEAKEANSLILPIMPHSRAGRLTGSRLRI